MISKLFRAIGAHKGKAFFILLLIIGGGYFGYAKFAKKDTPMRYVLAVVEKGTIISSVSGSGQVSTSNQVDLKPKASGDLTALNVKNGQEVASGALIAQLDARDALKSVRDAEANLVSAKLSLEKLQQPADALSIIQAENSLAQAKESKQDAEADLVKAHDDAFNNISNAFLDLPEIMQGLDDVLYNDTVGISGQDNILAYADLVKNFDERTTRYREEVATNYTFAYDAYQKNFEDYKASSRNATPDAIEALLNETYLTTKAIAESIKSTNNYIDFVLDILTKYKLKTPTVTATHKTNLESYTGKTNSLLTSLLGIVNTIKTAKDTIVNTDRSIIEKTESLKNLKADPDPLDLASAKLSITQKENALQDVKEKLADYYVRAPFEGVIVGVAVKKGDAVSASTVIATLITKQRVAEISLNEVDAAKITQGQKATLTFDAVEGLSISGSVGDIDTLGTVSQGVVTYTAKIIFDTQDARVKPGMSVSASIITDMKQDVLMVPNAAIKSSGQGSYVEVPGETVTANAMGNTGGIILMNAPKQQAIQIGMANDTSTEVTSGLEEGSIVVSRTISAGSTNTTSGSSSGNSANRSILNVGGGGGSPSGGFR